ncbi:MAG TPA: hypothetical protein VEQ85_14650 [Lacipirellulaceae bacterium]|nr:hypothetical protein [Lacipirellulaceae bacterium]
MRRLLTAVAGLLLAAAPLSAAIDERADAPTPERAAPGLPAVRDLIAQLGSDDYSTRRRAEEQLLRIGPEAFDELKAAESHSDLEIADRVRYIVQRMRVPWVHPDDPEEVRLLFTRFGDLGEDGREQRVQEFAALPKQAGLAALCRIARFDSSPLVARRAATALAGTKLGDAERTAVAAACLAELGPSQRAPAQWIRIYFREAQGYDVVAGPWAEAIEQEIALLRETSADTDFEIVQALVSRELEQARRAGSATGVTAGLLRVVELIAEQLEAVRQAEARDQVQSTLYALVRWEVDYEESDERAAALAWALRWAIKHRQWAPLEALEDRYAETVVKHRRLLYLLGAAMSRAGRDDRATELANRAFELVDDDEDVRVATAKFVAEAGRVDWAEREYRRVLDAHPLLDPRCMAARNELAMWLHDRQDFQQAADLLSEFFDGLYADPAARKRLLEQMEAEGSSGREELRALEARHQYYLACVDEQNKNYEAQRRRLEDAATKYDKDPDILIAMYRSPGADEDYRQRTRARILKMRKATQELIDQYPDLPMFYNQWAWLIANTEGDQQQAVAYSLRSLELSPDEPSYLDTLGRCYYAVGDFENAVQSQQKAVDMAPHYGVMRRQLELFKQALADEQAK